MNPPDQNQSPKDPGLLQDLNQVRVQTKEAGNALNDLFQHGNSRIIGPLATKALGLTKRLVSKLYYKVVGVNVEVRDPDDHV